MKRNRFVIIGLDNIGQELLGKLSRDFEIVCVDINPEAEEQAKKIRGEDVKVITGDATSRLVLEEAEVDDAEAVIITTTTEKINIEVARVLKDHFNPRRVISVVNTKTGIETLEALGVEVQDIFATSATGIRNTLEQKTRAAHAIGVGKNEILEVEVHPHSRLANKPLGSLAFVRWKIGIIYREGNIIIPQRDTVLKPKDRVVILGDPAVLKTLSEILTFRFQQFPLEYGTTVIAYVSGKEDEKYFNELDYLFAVLPLQKIIIIYSDNAAAQSEKFKKLIKKDHFERIEEQQTSLSPYNAIESTISKKRGEYGLIALSKDALIDSSHPFIFNARKKSFLHKLSSVASCPILLIKGNFPYKKIVIPCVEGIDLQHDLETALEISSSLNNEITALLVHPSQYISSEEEFEDFKTMKKTISEISLMYKSSVKTSELRGNPIKAVTGVLNNYNLLLVDTGRWKRQSRFFALFNPDVVWHIVKNSPISTLLIPSVKESI